jgi:transposase
MKRFIEGAERHQSTLLPECLDDWVAEDNPVRAVDTFVDALDLSELGFTGVEPAATGRPSSHPAPLLKLYAYGYLNRVQSSRAPPLIICFHSSQVELRTYEPHQPLVA